MPPKPNKKLDREKSRIMAALASTATPGTFETNFQALRAAHTENGTPAAIKSAFARLSPDIEKFITDINQLKAHAMQAILTDNDRTIISFAEERIGLSFKYNNQNELARSHFNEALAQNAHLGPFFNLMSIETSPVTIKKLREDLLDASCQPRHLKRDNYLTERLKTEANGLLDTYIAESSPNLKTYFKKHAPLL